MRLAVSIFKVYNNTYAIVNIYVILFYYFKQKYSFVYCVGYVNKHSIINLEINNNTIINYFVLRVMNPFLKLSRPSILGEPGTKAASKRDNRMGIAR